GHSLESTTVFKTFYRIDAEHGFAKVCMKFVKDGFSQAWWHMLCHTAHDSPHCVTVFAYFVNEINHLFRHLGIRASHDVFFGFLKVKFLVRLVQRNIAYLTDIGIDADPVMG